MVHKPIIFVDVETNGYSAKNGRVIEIGAVRVENGKIVGTLNKLVNPGSPIPYFISSLTGITDEDLWSAPHFREITEDIYSLFDGCIFAAHNVDFDYSFIREEFSRLGENISMDRFCTAKLSRIVYPEHRRHNLDSIISRRGYDIARRHRAYDDALVLHTYVSDMVIEFGPTIFQHIDKVMKRSPTPKPYNRTNKLL